MVVEGIRVGGCDMGEGAIMYMLLLKFQIKNLTLKFKILGNFYRSLYMM
jgi:hypothetical protein